MKNLKAGQVVSYKTIEALCNLYHIVLTFIYDDEESKLQLYKAIDAVDESQRCI